MALICATDSADAAAAPEAEAETVLPESPAFVSSKRNKLAKSSGGHTYS